MDRIRDAAAHSRVFVLNGDIFDFKWSVHGLFPHSVVAARAFLESLIQPNPHCRFVVLMGNHDCVPPYRDALEDLTREFANFEWHEFFYQRGERVFLHGDVIHAGPSHESIRSFRSRLSEPSSAGSLHRLAHRSVHGSKLPGMAIRMIPKRMLARRILRYLDLEMNGTFGEVRHVYFGHTHADFEDFQHDGRFFHNCGSATHGARLRLVQFPL